MSEVRNETIEDIINLMKKNNKKTDSKLIRQAYEFAKSKHGSQLRKSGEPYIIHPVQVAYILATIGLDDSTICAAILHDVAEDTEVTIRYADKLGRKIIVLNDAEKMKKQQWMRFHTS